MGSPYKNKISQITTLYFFRLNCKIYLEDV